MSSYANSKVLSKWLLNTFLQDSLIGTSKNDIDGFFQYLLSRDAAEYSECFVIRTNTNK